MGDLKSLFFPEKFQCLAEKSGIKMKNHMTLGAFKMLMMSRGIELIIISPIFECQASQDSYLEKKINRTKNARSSDVWKFSDEIICLEQMKSPDSVE